jgi:hypothetical protein
MDGSAKFSHKSFGHKSRVFRPHIPRVSDTNSVFFGHKFRVFRTQIRRVSDTNGVVTPVDAPPVDKKWFSATSSFSLFFCHLKA